MIICRADDVVAANFVTVNTSSFAISLRSSQLPPVNIKGGFAFQAKCWNKLLDKSVLLTKVYRQGDPVLLDVLAEARVGALSDRSVSVLREHERNPPPEPPASAEGPAVEFTRLECKNVDVDRGNTERLEALKADPYNFVANDYDPTGYRLKSLTAPSSLTLKVGAQVMLLKNLDPDNNLVNGSRGVVTRFTHWTDGRREDPEFTLPKGWSKDTQLPVVNFGGADKVMTPRRWEITEGEDVKAYREQLPLRLAWVLSVHKSQGMTISHLDLNLRGVFEYGQAYVALSRGVSMEGIRIRNFEPGGFKASGTVKEFYRALGDVQGRRGGGARPAQAQAANDPQRKRRRVEGEGEGGENDGARSNGARARLSASATTTTTTTAKDANSTGGGGKEGLTEEQRRRMEESKAKAKRIRAEKQRAEQLRAAAKT